jgi:hypothetical protein
VQRVATTGQEEPSKNQSAVMQIANSMPHCNVTDMMMTKRLICCRHRLKGTSKLHARGRATEETIVLVMFATRSVPSSHMLMPFMGTEFPNAPCVLACTNIMPANAAHSNNSSNVKYTQEVSKVWFNCIAMEEFVIGLSLPL